MFTNNQQNNWVDWLLLAEFAYNNVVHGGYGVLALLSQHNWVDWLLLAEFASNNVVHEAMGYLPFFLNKGQNPRMLPEDEVEVSDSSAGDHVIALQKATKAAEKSL
jgi:hypothetical protein